MVSKEGQRAIAGQSGSFCVIAGAHIAVEAMACIFIPVDLNFRMGLRNLIDLLGRNVCVEFAEVKLNRSGRVFIREITDAARIESDCRVGMEAGGAEPGKKAAVAVSDYA